MPGNVLHGAAPREAHGVEHAARITDGETPRGGDAWRSALSAELRAGAYVVYDLGASRALDALFLVADNNDRFELEISDDARAWRPLWSAPPVDEPGMRERFAGQLGARGRYLRLTARGGDAYVSIGELLAFEATPEPFPPKVPRTSSGSPYAGEQRAVTWLGAVLALCMLGCLARAPAWLGALCVALALAAVLAAGRRLSPLWPLHPDILSWLRVVLAGLGALGLWIARGRARPWAITALLSLTALLAIACFYNFGRPWFWDAAHRRPTPVHTFDLRVYYPVAKYFDELRFDGLYFASVAAYAEGKPAPLSAIDDTELRDLRDNRMVRVRDVHAEIEHSPARFSPARWAAFKEDMRYFWETMGHEYLSTLRDHGGNATPAWLALAHLLFAPTRASEHLLTLTALLDPLLLVALLVCVGRSFGRYTMLACMIVFGATDFPMLGSNWAGATLRFDWMVALGLAACALHVGRAALGGALLGYAAMMRAFPAASLALLVAAALAPAAIRAARAARAQEGWLSARELIAEHRAALVAAGAALAVMLALFAFSSALLGLEAGWGEWAHKIALHNEKSSLNHVGLRTVLSYDPELSVRKLALRPHDDLWRVWHDAQRATFRARAPLFWLAALAFVAGAVAACRRGSLARPAVLGLLLVPVLSYPANYYLHAVYLVPIAAGTLARRRGYALELSVLALCAAQYWTLGIEWPVGHDERFVAQSALLLLMTAFAFAAAALPERGAAREPAGA